MDYLRKAKILLGTFKSCVRIKTRLESIVVQQNSAGFLFLSLTSLENKPAPHPSQKSPKHQTHQTKSKNIYFTLRMKLFAINTTIAVLWTQEWQNTIYRPKQSFHRLSRLSWRDHSSSIPNRQGSFLRIIFLPFLPLLYLYVLTSIYLNLPFRNTLVT